MDIMRKQDHRPWPMSSKPWIMRQTWKNVLFAHWPIPKEQLRPHIPSGLEMDTYDGSAWLGVIVLEIGGIYPRGLLSRSVVQRFPEVNLRTYVHYCGKPGVLFLSLDVENWASLNIAKRWYHLPYQKAKVSLQNERLVFRCHSMRNTMSNIPIVFKGNYYPNSETFLSEKGSLTHWFTERYCLFSTNKKGNLFCGEIHHEPWPLQKARAEINSNTLATPFQINLNEVEPVLHFSKGIDTVFWNIKKL